MGAATTRFPALLHITGEIAAAEVDEETGNLIPLPRSIAITTISSFSVDQTLTIGT
jgi:hypothetical protein